MKTLTISKRKELRFSRELLKGIGSRGARVKDSPEGDAYVVVPERNLRGVQALLKGGGFPEFFAALRRRASARTPRGQSKLFSRNVPISKPEESFVNNNDINNLHPSPRRRQSRVTEQPRLPERAIPTLSAGLGDEPSLSEQSSLYISAPRRSAIVQEVALASRDK